MTYEVLIEELRTAAGGYDGVAGRLGADGPAVTHVTPESLGHVELAAWLTAVVEQCDNAATALHDGATGLAESLRSAAHQYETTDQGVGEVFTTPFNNGLLGPSGTTGSPFGTTP